MCSRGFALGALSRESAWKVWLCAYSGNGGNLLRRHEDTVEDLVQPACLVGAGSQRTAIQMG